jgi:hypothetical protein
MQRHQDVIAATPLCLPYLLVGVLGPMLIVIRSKNWNHSWIDCFSNISLLNRLLLGRMRGNDLKELFVLSCRNGFFTIGSGASKSTA